MSKWCGDENCLQCADKEPDPYVHLPREEYVALREQNRVLWEALQAAKYELAALFPIPSAPTVHAALEVCGNNNEADARCIYLAYEAICAALTATSQPGGEG